jgi:hypothetical protein
MLTPEERFVADETDKDTFRKHRPQISEQEAVQAAKDGLIIQSFNAHPIPAPDGTIPALAIKWKFSNGNTETVLIGPYAARVLRLTFSRLEENLWTELATPPPDATQQ